MPIALILNDKLLEILPDGAGVPFEERYHPDFLALCEEVPESAQPGFVREGKGWAAPPAPLVTPPAAVPDPLDALRALLAANPSLIDRLRAGKDAS